MKLTLIAGALAALMAVAGCRSMVDKPPEPTPELPTIQGIWQGAAEIEWRGGTATATQTLTLTASRYVRSATVPDGSGTATWTDWGAWSVDEDVLTLTSVSGSGFLRTPAMLASPTEVPYQWGDETRQTATMNIWSDVEFLSAEPSFTRQRALTVDDMMGVWLQFWGFRDENPDAPGDVVRVARRLTLRSDGAATYWSKRTYDNQETTFEQYDGTYTFDADELFVLMTVESVERTSDHDGVDAGHVLRTAFAPMEASRMDVSHHWNEQMLDEETKTWVDNEEYPYGRYDRSMYMDP